jgi:hypothetical protein
MSDHEDRGEIRVGPRNDTDRSVGPDSVLTGGVMGELLDSSDETRDLRAAHDIVVPAAQLDEAA